MTSAAFAAIPPPPFDMLTLGPLELRMYGLCIALGVIAAVMISSRRWEAQGGNPDDIGSIALWAVPAGVIGARMYHVATDWKTYQGDWIEAFKITNGGLGIPGGILGGVIVGIIVARKRGLPIVPLLDVVAPAIPVAQAIGRLGNWFNQELFGRPTELPWGLEVDPEHVPAGYAPDTLFHPTFLYEALWNLGLAGLLVLLGRRGKLRAGELFTLYVAGYALGRLWVEELRIDHASLILGIRVNIWMSVIVGAVAILVFVRNRMRPAPVAEGTAGAGAGRTDALAASVDEDEAGNEEAGDEEAGEDEAGEDEAGGVDGGDGERVVPGEGATGDTDGGGGSSGVEAGGDGGAGD